MTEMNTLNENFMMGDEKSLTPHPSSFRLGYSDGERWSTTNACHLEHKHLVNFVRSAAGEAWTVSDATADDLAHELFFALVGESNAADGLGQANAFWQKFCPNALKDRNALDGFAKGAFRGSSKYVQRFPNFSPFSSESAWDAAVQELYARLDSWQAGVSWAINTATAQELRNVRSFADNHKETWLGPLTTYTDWERLFFAIAGRNTDTSDAGKYWTVWCPNFGDTCESAKSFVRGVCFVDELTSERQNNTFPSLEKIAWLIGNCTSESRVALADCYEHAWQAGVEWTFDFATSQERDNIRAFVDCQGHDWPASEWEERLLAFSTHSRLERVYFAITCGEKSERAAQAFWEARCPEVFERANCVNCFVLGTCFALELCAERTSNVFPPIEKIDRAIHRFMLWREPPKPVKVLCDIADWRDKF